jgi:Domain of unknown function (DUF3536)/Glycosyl hydrolase family 57
MNVMTLDTQPGLVNIAVHGHFYQPERADAFTGIIPVEKDAAPYTNFNERITAECYRPNAEAGNFDLMSFDMGPTLACWLSKAHRDVYDRIIEADRRHMERFGVGNALAQPYNHTILPLLSSRDKRTQIHWGLSDFRYRYGREAEGMWYPETAVDLESLDIAASCGIQFTILAPWQAATPIDSTEPYLVQLPSGRRITAFFYHDWSSGVSYDDDATADANQFAANFRRASVNHAKAEAKEAQLILVASDGELYGHHKPFRDLFLKYFLRWGASGHDLEPCSLSRYLLAHPARRAVEIHVPSSWSCQWHGVARWNTGCSCTEGDASWKYPLRHALTQLAEKSNALFEQYAGHILADPWAARDGYLALRNGWEPAEYFWARHGVTAHLDIAQVRAAMQLLEAQYWIQASFTSCGWFFEDLDRIEPRNDIAFTRRAVSLLWQATGHDLQQDLLRDLAEARSWRTGRTGADLYRSLPVVPANLLPAQ